MTKYKNGYFEIQSNGIKLKNKLNSDERILAIEDMLETCVDILESDDMCVLAGYLNAFIINELFNDHEYGYKRVIKKEFQSHE